MPASPVRSDQTLDWPDVADADSYRVAVSGAGEDFNAAASLRNGPFDVTPSQIGADVVFAGLAAGIYGVQVRSVRGSDLSPWSAPKDFDLTPPGTPDPPVVV